MGDGAALPPGAGLVSGDGGWFFGSPLAGLVLGAVGGVWQEWVSGLLSVVGAARLGDSAVAEFEGCCHVVCGGVICLCQIREGPAHSQAAVGASGGHRAYVQASVQ